MASASSSGGGGAHADSLEQLLEGASIADLLGLALEQLAIANDAGLRLTDIAVSLRPATTEVIDDYVLNYLWRELCDYPDIVIVDEASRTLAATNRLRYDVFGIDDEYLDKLEKTKETAAILRLLQALWRSGSAGITLPELRKAWRDPEKPLPSDNKSELKQVHYVVHTLSARRLLFRPAKTSQPGVGILLLAPKYQHQHHDSSRASKENARLRGEVARLQRLLESVVGGTLMLADAAGILGWERKDAQQIAHFVHEQQEAAQAACVRAERALPPGLLNEPERSWQYPAPTAAGAEEDDDAAADDDPAVREEAGGAAGVGTDPQLTKTCATFDAYGIRIGGVLPRIVTARANQPAKGKSTWSWALAPASGGGADLPDDDPDAVDRMQQQSLALEKDVLESNDGEMVSAIRSSAAAGRAEDPLAGQHDELTRLVGTLDKASDEMRAKYPVCFQLCVLAHPTLCIHRHFPAIIEHATATASQFTSLPCWQDGVTPGTRSYYALPLATLLEVPACRSVLWAWTRMAPLWPSGLQDVHVPELLRLLLRCAGHEAFRLGDVVVTPVAPPQPAPPPPTALQLIKAHVAGGQHLPPVTTMELSTEMQVLRAASLSGSAGITGRVIRDAFGLRPKTVDSFVKDMPAQRMLIGGVTRVRKTKTGTVWFPRPMPTTAADAAMRAMLANPFEAAHINVLRQQLTAGVPALPLQLSAGGSRADLIAGINAWTALRRVDTRLTTTAVTAPVPPKQAPATLLCPLSTSFSRATVQRMLVRRVGRAKELVFVFPEAGIRASTRRLVVAIHARLCVNVNARGFRWMHIARNRAPLIDPKYLIEPLRIVLPSTDLPVSTLSARTYVALTDAERTTASIAERAMSRLGKHPRTSGKVAAPALDDLENDDVAPSAPVEKRKRGRPPKPKAAAPASSALSTLQSLLLPVPASGDQPQDVFPVAGKRSHVVAREMASDVLKSAGIDAEAAAEPVLLVDEDASMVPVGSLPVDDVTFLQVAVRESVQAQAEQQQRYLERLASWEGDWAESKGQLGARHRKMPQVARFVELPAARIGARVHLDAATVRQRLTRMPHTRPDLISYERTLHAAERSAAGVGWYTGPVWAVTLISGAGSAADDTQHDLHHFDAEAVAWLAPASAATNAELAPTVTEHGSSLWSCMATRSRAHCGATNMLLASLTAVDAAWSAVERGAAPVSVGSSVSSATAAIIKTLGTGLVASGTGEAGATSSGLLHKSLTVMEQQGWLMRVTARGQLLNLRKLYTRSKETRDRVLDLLHVPAHLRSSDAEAVKAATNAIKDASCFPRWEPTLLYDHTDVEASPARGAFAASSLLLRHAGGEAALAAVRASDGGALPEVLAKVDDGHYHAAFWDMACTGDRVWPATVPVPGGLAAAGVKRSADDAAEGDDTGKKARRRVDFTVWPGLMSHVRLRMRERPVTLDADDAFSSLVHQVTLEADTVAQALLQTHAADLEMLLQERAQPGVTALDVLLLLAEANEASPCRQRLRERMQQLSSGASDVSVTVLALRRAMMASAGAQSLLCISSAVGDIVCPPAVAPCFATRDADVWRDVHIWSTLPGAHVDSHRFMRLVRYLLHTVHTTGPCTEGKLVASLSSIPPGSVRKMLRFLVHVRLLTVRHHVTTSVAGPAPGFAEIAWLQRESRPLRASDTQRACAHLWSVAPAATNPAAVVLGEDVYLDAATTPMMDGGELLARLERASADPFPVPGWTTSYTLHATCLLRAAHMFAAMCAEEEGRRGGGDAAAEGAADDGADAEADAAVYDALEAAAMATVENEDAMDVDVPAV